MKKIRFILIVFIGLMVLNPVEAGEFDVSLIIYCKIKGKEISFDTTKRKRGLGKFSKSRDGIAFSETTFFAIIDIYGNPIASGSGSFVDLTALDVGAYYLKVQNNAKWVFNFVVNK